MSTRANIYVFDTEIENGIWFYRHSDGYPDGAMCPLLKFMKWLNDGTIIGEVGSAAPWLIAIGMEEYHGGENPKRPRNPITRPGDDSPGTGIGWKIGSIELTTEMHGDIEYYYEINLTDKTLTANEVIFTPYYKGKKYTWNYVLNQKNKIPYGDIESKLSKKKLFTVTSDNLSEHIVKYCKNETFSAPEKADFIFESGYADVINRFSPKPNCVEWSKWIGWQPRLCINASTYTAPELFDTAPVMEKSINANTFEDGTYVDSPSHRFRYANLNLPKGTKLTIMDGWDKGYVEFDGDVVIPALFERKKGSEKFMSDPWMSITPNELITLRPGTDMAKGVVVIGGLGLGHQLIEVCKKDIVTDVILVEQSKELVDWLLPIIKKDNPKVEEKLGKVIVGNAYKEIPKLTADVALIDIYPGYGDQTDDQELFEMKSKNIGNIWLWQAGKELEECSHCGEYIEEGDEERCVDCGWTFCPDCMLECPDCGKMICIECEGNNDGYCGQCYEDRKEKNPDDYKAPKGKLKEKITKKKVLMAAAISTVAVASFLTYNSEFMRKKFGWSPIYNPGNTYHEYMEWREKQ